MSEMGIRLGRGKKIVIGALMQETEMAGPLETREGKNETQEEKKL